MSITFRSATKEVLITVIGGGVVYAALMVGGRFMARNPKPVDNLSDGDRLSISLDLSQHQRNIILATRPDCPYCRASARFHQNLLATAVDNNIGFVIAVNDKQSSAQYLQASHLAGAHVVETDLTKMKIAGTPTVALVDSAGVVLRTWQGQLSPDQEDQLIQRVSRRDTLPREIEAKDVPSMAEARGFIVVDITRREVKHELRWKAVVIPSDEMEARAPIELTGARGVILDCGHSFSLECDATRVVLEHQDLTNVTSVDRGKDEPGCDRKTQKK